MRENRLSVRRRKSAFPVSKTGRISFRSDYTLSGGFNALRALELLKNRSLDIPLVVLSGAVAEETMVECMRQGAADYLLNTR